MAPDSARKACCADWPRVRASAVSESRLESTEQREGGCGDGDGGGGAHGVDDGAEVLVVLADDDRDGELRGLKRVVAAGGDEAAADEGGAGDGVKAGELADGIEQEDGAGGDGAAGPDGAADEGDGVGVEQAGDGVEALGMARGQDADERRDGGDERREAFQDGQLFAGEGAAADEDAGGFRQGAGEFSGKGAGGGGTDVELEVAGHGDAGGGRAHGDEARGVLRALGAEDGDAGEQGSDERAQEAVTREGAVRDAGVDHGDGDEAARALQDEVGPELGLDEDEEDGVEGTEIAAVEDGEVEREVEDAAGAEAAGGEVVSGAGGGGDADGMAGKGAFEFGDKAGGGDDFADGDGVQPDRGASGDVGAQGGRDEAEALRQAGAVLAGGDHAEEPPGRGHDERKEQGEAVKDPHAHSSPIRPTDRGYTAVAMTKDNRTAMKRWIAFVVLAGALGAGGTLAARTAEQAARRAADYPNVDTHAQEQVSIAAEAFDTPEAGSFQLHYVEWGVMPVKIIVSNDGDRPISLTEVRMQFVNAEHERLPAALPDEVVRIMSSVARSEKGPAPHLPFTLPHKTVEQKVHEDMDHYGFQALLVGPHATETGFLWYDMHGQAKPWVKGAEIYVKMVQDENGRNLFPFEIHLDKTTRVIGGQ